MSEHTPLTEAERESLREWALGVKRHNARCSIEPDTLLELLDLAARTSTATADTCPGCGHPTHGDTDCGEVVGYDHLNGDHECGCPGPEALGALVDAATADTDQDRDRLLNGLVKQHRVDGAATPDATADTGLRERVEALARSPIANQYRDEACRHAVAQPYADNRYVRLLDDIRAALDATAAPTADTEGPR